MRSLLDNQKTFIKCTINQILEAIHLEHNHYQSKLKQTLQQAHNVLIKHANRANSSNKPHKHKSNIPCRENNNNWQHKSSG